MASPGRDSIPFLFAWDHLEMEDPLRPPMARYIYVDHLSQTSVAWPKRTPNVSDRHSERTLGDSCLGTPQTTDPRSQLAAQNGDLQMLQWARANGVIQYMVMCSRN